MAAEDARLIVVDAANVIGSRPDGWWRDRSGAARRLLERMTGLPERLAESAELIVVLEGAAKAAVDAAHQEVGGVRVMRADGSGDDAIVGVVAAAHAEDGSRPITVVTADRELRDRVAAFGAETVGPSWLLDRIGS
ncbi:NYN domain-containing protein [Nocardia araoensis]|uniref:NYN domain-containing protein n=1 Tax=Nocardia araoensis TaxID=228600 RepID=UPI0002D9D8E4|nr:NYN domain-containing protein [Nocardia araoensis]